MPKPNDKEISKEMSGPLKFDTMSNSNNKIVSERISEVK